MRPIRCAGEEIFQHHQTTVRDTIPKIIVRFMDKKVEEVYSSLLAESEAVAANRREAKARLEDYELAVQLARELAIA
ncbi:hypothetical protein BV898_18417 [Hypsibius exemplaris]|uniref:Uncharacterized protein n=1 Tax=Hypsibius exemplaris TaxID=2072580 RepID=A0A9X6NQ72_HYPEX|nr:hypothetical protein BV898_18417 [Hypsibius exemplaris]